MAAERDTKARVIHGVYYPVEEMKYFCRAEMLLYPTDCDKKRSLKSYMEFLEGLPADTSVSYKMDPITRTFHFSIAYLGVGGLGAK